MTEQEWDQKLHIDTIGRDASMEDAYHHPYEPTPYTVLERIVESGYLSSYNKVIDYGCGKGRVGFFLGSQLGCKTVGIEFDAKICDEARENLAKWKGTMSKNNGTQCVVFQCIAAEKYEVADEDTFYFFNPFSVEILKNVVGKIKKSYYENPREIRLFFYYPSDEYISYLMTVAELCFLDEIDCSDLFEENKEREKIVIFEMM